MITTPKQPKNYAIVCNEVAQRKDLSARAKGVYYYLATLPSEWKLNKQELIQHFTEGRKAINTAFKELEIAGYVLRTVKQKKNGKFTGQSYQVFWTSQPSVQKRVTPQKGNTFNGVHIDNTQKNKVKIKESNKRNKELDTVSSKLESQTFFKRVIDRHCKNISQKLAVSNEEHLEEIDKLDIYQINASLRVAQEFCDDNDIGYEFENAHIEDGYSLRTIYDDEQLVFMRKLNLLDWFIKKRIEHSKKYICSLSKNEQLKLYRKYNIDISCLGKKSTEYLYYEIVCQENNEKIEYLEDIFNKLYKV